jgi:hypothetical protein
VHGLTCRRSAPPPIGSPDQHMWPTAGYIWQPHGEDELRRPMSDNRSSHVAGSGVPGWRDAPDGVVLRGSADIAA